MWWKPPGSTDPALPPNPPPLSLSKASHTLTLHPPLNRYVGEIVTEAEAEMRQNDAYLFSLDDKVRKGGVEGRKEGREGREEGRKMGWKDDRKIGRKEEGRKMGIKEDRNER